MSFLRPLTIGNIELANNLISAPMAGVTDRPFRMLNRRLGAGLAVSEMLTADKRLWETRKSRLRMDHSGEPGPIAVQIAGGDADVMVEAARINADYGAQIIDINMGCPAKKICRKAAGSALLSDEPLVAEILEKVCASVDVPVTLKIRTGPDPDHRNALTVARLAEESGIAMLSVHGRTRACAYRGHAEYETIAAAKESVSIPVIANGDINTPDQALRVFQSTNADGIMIGRGAQGNPWIFREIAHFLTAGEYLTEPSSIERREVLLKHVADLHGFYGDFSGVRVARKHIGWYLKGRPAFMAARRELMTIECPAAQLAAIATLFDVAPTVEQPRADLFRSSRSTVTSQCAAIHC